MTPLSCVPPMLPQFAAPPSIEEQTWLLFENSLPLSIEKDDSDRPPLPSKSVINFEVLNSPQFKSVFPMAPCSEWVYRTPKSSSNPSSNLSNFQSSTAHPPLSLSRSRSRSNASSYILTEDRYQVPSSSNTNSLSPSVPRVRTRRTQPPPSEFDTSGATTATRKVPVLSPIKAPTQSHTLDSDSVSHSPSSSRSDSPVTPISLSSMHSAGRRRSYDLPRRHRRGSHSLDIRHSSPSKSILTRTASVSTKASNTINKSVKFATIPTVHYATRAYWDVDNAHANTIEINIDSMELDDDPFANYRSREGSILEAEDSFTSQRLDLQSSTPTSSERLNLENPNRIKRLIHRARNSARSGHGNNRSSERPVISSPYALGSYPGTRFHVVAAVSSSSLVPQPWMSSLPLGKNSEAAESTSSVVLPADDSFISETFRRPRTSGTISLRSVESTSSRVERFRTWLGRKVGWSST